MKPVDVPADPSSQKPEAHKNEITIRLVLDLNATTLPQNYQQSFQNQLPRLPWNPYNFNGYNPISPYHGNYGWNQNHSGVYGSGVSPSVYSTARENQQFMSQNDQPYQAYSQNFQNSSRFGTQNGIPTPLKTDDFVRSIKVPGNFFDRNNMFLPSQSTVRTETKPNDEMLNPAEENLNGSQKNKILTELKENLISHENIDPLQNYFAFDNIGQANAEYDQNQNMDFSPENDSKEENLDRLKNPLIEIELSHFKNLNTLLLLIFSGVAISEHDWKLSQLEEKILNAILKRKFYSKVQSDGLRLDETNKFKFINELAKVNTLKRPKDCYKMLLGRLFRILKTNYFENNKSTNQNVYLFYQYYFGELARSENLPIQGYFYPFERNNKFISLFPRISHHLNFRYYEKIFKSPRLTNDIKVILQKVRVDHYAELKFKFSTLLKKWEKIFFNFDNDIALVEKTILKYLQYNNRCKIPFTVGEIENSIYLFEKMIQKFEN